MFHGVTRHFRWDYDYIRIRLCVIDAFGRYNHFDIFGTYFHHGYCLPMFEAWIRTVQGWLRPGPNSWCHSGYSAPLLIRYQHANQFQIVLGISRVIGVFLYDQVFANDRSNCCFIHQSFGNYFEFLEFLPFTLFFRKF